MICFTLSSTPGIAEILLMAQTARNGKRFSLNVAVKDWQADERGSGDFAIG
jgi:hypothetical protein